MDVARPRLQVLIAVAGSPALLDAQLAAIERFLPGGTRVLIVDDTRRRPHHTNSRESRTHKRIMSVADQYEVSYFRFPQHLHFMRSRLFHNPSRRLSTGPSLRTSDSIQYGVSNVGSDRDFLLILDSDMVPIRSFDPFDYLHGAAVGFLPQSRQGVTMEVIYPWPGIFLADLRATSSLKAMDWDCSVVDGVALDAGGAMATWLRDNAQSTRPIVGLHSGKWRWREDDSTLPDELHEFLDFDAQLNGGYQFAELFESSFLHLRAGSNWDKSRRESFETRMKLFTQGINRLAKG